MTDPRLENLISIADPSKSRVAGTWPGQKSGPLHNVTQDAKNAAEAVLRSAENLRSNRNLSPGEIGQRMLESSGPALKSLNAATVKLSREKDVLRQKLIDLNPTKGYRDVGHWQPEHDLRLLDHFNALPVPQREAMRLEMTKFPMLHLNLSEALMRTPPEITGLDRDSLRMIKVGLTKAFKRTEFDQLDESMNQLEVAEQTLRMSVEAIRETTGSMQDVIQNAPDAFKFSTAPPEPLGWMPS